MYALNNAFIFYFESRLSSVYVAANNLIIDPHERMIFALKFHKNKGSNKHYQKGSKYNLWAFLRLEQLTKCAKNSIMVFVLRVYSVKNGPLSLTHSYFQLTQRRAIRQSLLISVLLLLYMHSYTPA